MYRLGNIHDINRFKAVRTARRDIKAGNSIWFNRRTSFPFNDAAFPSESGMKAIKEFRDHGYSLANHLKEAATLYGNSRSRGVWTEAFNETESKFEIVKENYCSWICHGRTVPLTFLILQAELFIFNGYESNSLKEWMAGLKKWNDYMVNLKGYAKKDELERLKERAIADISKYSKEHPLSRSALANYFLPRAFGGDSPEAAARYDKFSKIVGEMLKLQPRFNKAAQKIIADSKRR